MENNEKDHIQLPDNAFTELKPGEEYQPVMEPGRSYPEVNLWRCSSQPLLPTSD